MFVSIHRKWLKRVVRTVLGACLACFVCEDVYVEEGERCSPGRAEEVVALLETPCTPVLPRAKRGSNCVRLGSCDTLDVQLNPTVSLSGMHAAPLTS